MAYTREYIKEVQRDINHFSSKHDHIIEPLLVDGQLGSGTKAAIKRAKYFLGYVKKYQTWSDISPAFLHRLSHPTYKLNLVQIARGLARRKLARQIHLDTVQGCAKFLLASPGARFIYRDDNGDTARAPIEDLATGRLAYVNHNGSRTHVNLNLMQALVEMAKNGTIYINCLTNGNHSAGSHHYSGTAVDLDNSSPLGYSRIVNIAAKHGGYKNYETSHYHLDF